MGGRRGAAAAVLPGWDLVLAAQEGMWQDEHGRLLNLLLRFLLSYWDMSLFIRYNDLFAVRLTLHFSFLEGNNGE